MFSGLIVFANGKFEEKIRFLFDLYDFNELNSLSVIDLEFMIISIANSSLKILLLNSEANEEEISQFINSFFAEDARINISQLLKWCSKTQEVC